MFQELRDHLAFLESCVRLPLTGYGVQQGTVKGFWADGWVSSNLSANIKLEKSISSIQIFGYVPEFCLTNQVSIHANSFTDTFDVSNTGGFQISLPVSFEQGEEITISIKSQESISGKAAGINEDTREVAFLLIQLRLD